jgi:hypothetical protein
MVFVSFPQFSSSFVTFQMVSNTTAALSATEAFKRANELNGDDNEQLSRGLGAVAARTTKSESVQPSE